jgi:hypothetical protein
VPEVDPRHRFDHPDPGVQTVPAERVDSSVEVAMKYDTDGFFEKGRAKHPSPVVFSPSGAAGSPER